MRKITEFKTYYEHVPDFDSESVTFKIDVLPRLNGVNQTKLLISTDIE